VVLGRGGGFEIRASDVKKNIQSDGGVPARKVYREELISAFQNRKGDSAQVASPKRLAKRTEKRVSPRVGKKGGLRRVSSEISVRSKTLSRERNYQEVGIMLCSSAIREERRGRQTERLQPSRRRKSTPARKKTKPSHHHSIDIRKERKNFR